jgi:hypothetical protein
VAPILTGVVDYVILRWIDGLIWYGNQISSILVLMLAFLLSYPVFVFFCGLFGGWEDATLEGVRRGADLRTMMKPLAWLFWKSSAIGATISPLHNRFPITDRQAALDEAISFTNQRVNL